jgi:O-antigen biosynthesis protein
MLLKRLARASLKLASLAGAIAADQPGLARQKEPQPMLAAAAEALHRVSDDKTAAGDPPRLALGIATAGWQLAGWRDRRYGMAAPALAPDPARDRVDALIDELAAIHEAILLRFVPVDLQMSPAKIVFGTAHRRDGTVTAVVPVTAAAKFAVAGIASLSRARTETALRILAVSDGTAPDDVVARLRAEAVAGRCDLIEGADLGGVTGAINRGLAEATGDCAVFLTADVAVADGWADRLRAIADGAPDIACVSPLSNVGERTAWPFAGHDNPLANADFAGLAAAAAEAEGSAAVALAVADGACAYLPGEALAAIGPFDAAAFAEEEGVLADWCSRAAAIGRRSVAAPGVFVFARGHAGFGGRDRLRFRRTQELLAGRHRDYSQRMREARKADPLAGARRALDGALFSAERGRAARPIVHLIHAWGGGAAVHAGDLARKQAAEGAAVAIVQIAGPSTVRLVEPRHYPNLVFDLARPDDATLFRQVVGADGAALLHIHSVIGLTIAPLNTLTACFAATYLSLHDFYFICPQITLSDWNDRPCDVAPSAVCDRCVAAKKPFGPFIAPVQAHRDAYRAIAADAKAITTPSNTARTLLQRSLGDIAITVAPHDEVRAPILPLPRHAPGSRRTIVTIGSFSRDKGTPILQAVIDTAIARRLPLDFAIAGPATWTKPPPNVTVLGPYDSATIDDLLKRVGGEIAFLPSVVAETYMFSLSECVRAGCYPVVFDLGAQAERLRTLGWGTILPLATPPDEIADLLATLDIPPVEPRRVAQWLADGRLGPLDYYKEDRESLIGTVTPEA